MTQTLDIQEFSIVLATRVPSPAILTLDFQDFRANATYSEEAEGCALTHGG